MDENQFKEIMSVAKEISQTLKSIKTTLDTEKQNTNYELRRIGTRLEDIKASLAR